MAEIFTNMARSRLASSITDVATTLTVLTGDGNLLFPAAGAGDYFRFVLYNLTTGNVEICTCTSRTGDVLTISRAQEDIGNVAATAYAFNANDIIELRATAAFYGSLTVTNTNIQREAFNYAADSSGTPNDIAVTLSPAVTTLTAGLRVSVKVANTTTGATTLTVNGTAATAVKKYITEAIEAGDLDAGGIYTFVYDGTNFQVQNPASDIINPGVVENYDTVTGVATGTSIFTLDLGTVESGQIYLIDVTAIVIPGAANVVKGVSLLKSSGAASVNFGAGGASTRTIANTHPTTGGQYTVNAAVLAQVTSGGTLILKVDAYSETGTVTVTARGRAVKLISSS